MVGLERFELPRLTALDPKSSVSAIPPQPHLCVPVGFDTYTFSHFYWLVSTCTTALKCALEDFAWVAIPAHSLYR